MVASAALAEPIIIVSNGTGVAGLAFASENGIDDEASHPDTPGGPDSFHLTTRVGGTSADGLAAIASDLGDPLRLRATGSTSVSYATQIGVAEGHVSSFFFVFFEIDTPRQFLFDGDFETSGDAFSTPQRAHRSDWSVLLLAMGPGGSSQEVLAAQGTDSMRLVRDGLLSPGLYRFLVQGTSFGANLIPGPGSGSVFSNFRFSLALDADAPPVPEPGSLLLTATGLGALAAARRRKRAINPA
jgi:hypothetical protein